jgi:pimeloyl-ACP methyl ester carboxylesterase
MHEPLVLVPGTHCDARQFYPQVVSLGQERCVTVAPLAQGERIEEIASNILSGLPPKFALFGTDLGALVAMEIMRRAPDKVTRIALHGAHPLTETPQASANYEPLIIKVKAGQVKEAILGHLAGLSFAQSAPKAEILDMMEEMGRHQGGEVLVRQLRAKQRRRDQQATLRRCRVPAMVMCGAEASESSRKRHQFMNDMFHHSDMVWIDDAGDLPMLENAPGFTLALRAWLSQPMVLR